DRAASLLRRIPAKTQPESPPAPADFSPEAQPLRPPALLSRPAEFPVQWLLPAQPVPECQPAQLACRCGSDTAPTRDTASPEAETAPGERPFPAPGYSRQSV